MTSSMSEHDITSFPAQPLKMAKWQEISVGNTSKNKTAFNSVFNVEQYLKKMYNGRMYRMYILQNVQYRMKETFTQFKITKRAYI